MTYAPPEQLYGFLHPEFTTRRFGCDMYMLGTLASFMFTGANISAHMFENMDSQFHYRNWDEKYQDIIPYLKQSYFEVIDEISQEIDSAIVPDGANWIAQLCHPDLTRRGHPKSVGRMDQYSLHRYVSTFDRAARLAKSTVVLVGE